MPANFTRYPNSGESVFGADYAPRKQTAELALDAETLMGFGTLSVPGHVWRAMQRLGSWIDPVLAAEWARLTRRYAERQGRLLPPGEVEATLSWTEPTRDVRVARQVALARMAAGLELSCVWTDRPLVSNTLDVDHCLPWSAWPCGDLWNLLPTHRVTNQKEKRDLLPSRATMAAARDAVINWWDEAWRSNPAFSGRFDREVRAALPLSDGWSSTAVFEALDWRRLRLQQDQQLREWTPVLRL